MNRCLSRRALAPPPPRNGGGEAGVRVFRLYFSNKMYHKRLLFVRLFSSFPSSFDRSGALLTCPGPSPHPHFVRIFLSQSVRKQQEGEEAEKQRLDSVPDRRDVGNDESNPGEPKPLRMTHSAVDSSAADHAAFICASSIWSNCLRRSGSARTSCASLILRNSTTDLGSEQLSG